MKAEKLSGEVINKCNKYRYYIILLKDQSEIKVYFNRILEVIDLINGDLLEFYATIEEGHPIELCCVKKTGNRYFDELDWIVNSKETIHAYVYQRTEKGYKASYKGYSCFLPLSESTFKYIPNSEPDDLLNKELEFYVKEVRNDHIILSRLEIDKESKFKIRDLEIHSLTPGESFMASIINVVDYGVFLNKQNSRGLLHISKILAAEYEVVQLMVPRFYDAASSVFLPHKQLFVSVSNVGEHDYSLCWDRENKHNKPFWNALYERLFLNEYFDKIKNALVDNR